MAGARPNFMKVAPILAALERAGLPHSLVHTGQHYDASMSGVVLPRLDDPYPRSPSRRRFRQSRPSVRAHYGRRLSQCS